MLKHLIVLCCAFTATAVFGQTTYTWDGGPGGTGTEIGLSANWSGDTLPNPNNADTCLWDGTVPGNLTLTYAGGMGGGYGGNGLFFSFASTQTGTWTLLPPSSGGTAGLAIDSIYITNGAGAVTFGSTNPATNLRIVRRPQGGTRYYENSSAYAATIAPHIEWLAGGSVRYVHEFMGTGDWQVNNYLVDDATPAHDTSVQVDGPGRVFWNPRGYLGNQALGQINVTSEGTLVLQGNHPKLEMGGSYGQGMAFTIDGTFVFDAPGVSQILPALRPIAGSGTLVVSNGTLTLSGANTFSGTNLLGGGVLIVNHAEAEDNTSGPLGVNGTISFKGGTLKFSVVNTYDYSPRFDTEAGQAYSFDTAGQNVTFTNDLTSSGGTLTKLGAGTLSGPVTLSAGTILSPGAAAGSVGAFTINSNLYLGGNLAIEVNKSLSSSNDVVVVGGMLTNTGAGTLTVSNLGTALALGDKFTLFSQRVQNGAALTITGCGAIWANDLAVDGSISVTSVSVPALNFTNNGGSLQFSWDSSFGSYRLQSQTNSLDTGLGTNWVDYPGGGTGPVTVPIDTTKGTVFFRLVSP
jgi:autotransporter-associated beta strand protein